MVLVRFYLLVTAGSVCIKSGGMASKAVLLDLIDMAKGVQEPQRGLFARYYLAQRTKDKLPDGGSRYAGALLRVQRRCRRKRGAPRPASGDCMQLQLRLDRPRRPQARPAAA